VSLTKSNLMRDYWPRGLMVLRRLTHRQQQILKPIDPITPIRRKPSVDFSLTGLVYCSMMMFMGVAAVNSQANLLFGVFGLMIGILMISATVCRVVLLGLRVERVLPDQTAVGQRAVIQYRFFNSKRLWPSLSVCLAELDGGEAFTKQPHAYMLHAAPGMTATVPIELTPKRRGLHHLGNYQLSTSFPFGFIKRALVRKQPDPLMIYPAIGAVSSRLLSLCRSAERGGANMRPRRDGNEEFFGVKEFRDGENPRWIHWKRSAHTGKLVSKEMVQISPPRLLILLDTFLPNSTLAAHAAVEQCIAMAASLANRALDSGMTVGLSVWADGWAAIPLQRGKRHCRDILAALAELPANHVGGLQTLVGQNYAMFRDSVTPILFTPQSTHSGMGENVRGPMVVVAANSDRANAWFSFNPDVDFNRCMPADQQPPMTSAAPTSPPPHAQAPRPTAPQNEPTVFSR
jgi:uncharacterized protein (DUF58 family)